MSEKANEIIRMVSEEIIAEMKSCAMEERYPQKTADEMDAFIKERRETVQRLREIRSDLEYIFTGMLK